MTQVHKVLQELPALQARSEQLAQQAKQVSQEATEIEAQLVRLDLKDWLHLQVRMARWDLPGRRAPQVILDHPGLREVLVQQVQQVLLAQSDLQARLEQLVQQAQQVSQEAAEVRVRTERLARQALSELRGQPDLPEVQALLALLEPLVSQVQ